MSGEPNDAGRTAYLGQYGDFETDVVLEILREAGIDAHVTHPLTEPEHTQHPGALYDRGVVMVDATRLDDARALVDEQLPLHLASIRDAMEMLGADADADDVMIVQDQGPEDDGD